MNINQHNLSRTIPAKVKFEIRKNSGYGCVICGTGIIEYEHVNPDFKDCREHNPEKMTLLCPTCHSKKTRGFLSVETIERAMKNPKPKQLGFSKEVLDIGDKSPKIIFAGSLIIQCPVPIMVSNIPIIRILPPENDESPFRLSAIFFNSKGEITLKIIDNEWFSYSSNWDLEVKAGKIIISDSKNQLNLILKIVDSETIEIELIESLIGDIYIKGNGKELIVKNLKTGIENTFVNCISSHSQVGFSL
jgi:hypothetical protein